MINDISDEIKNLLTILFNKKYIGNAHVPEDFIMKRLKNVHDKKLRRQIADEWKWLENEGYIIRMKKRTSRGTDFHVSLNPKKIFEIKELLGIGETND